MTRLTYTLLLCPVCLEQVEHDPEYGAGCYHEEYGGNVDAIEVEVLSLDRMDLYPKRDLALFRLQEDRREADFRLAEQRWYDSLSVADRFWEDERRKRVRREEGAGASSLSGFMRVMQEAWNPEELKAMMGRQLFIGVVPVRGLDEWLAEDGSIREVSEALGL